VRGYRGAEVTRPLTLTCPICDADLTAEIEPGYTLDLTGCEHADAYAEGIMKSDAAELIDWAIERAVEEKDREMAQPQYDTWEEARGER
jgi:hypothetical protein